MKNQKIHRRNSFSLIFSFCHNTLYLGLFFVLCGLTSCSFSSDLVPPEIKAEHKEFKKITKLIRLETEQASRKCEKAFLLHNSLLGRGSKELSSDKNTSLISKSEASELLTKIESCKTKTESIKNNVIPLRERAVVYFKKYKEIREADLAKPIVATYASLVASIKIGLQEAEALLTPLEVHHRYISEYGLPEDQETIQKEKEYVYKRYRFYAEEQTLTLSVADKLLKELDGHSAY